MEKLCTDKKDGIKAENAPTREDFFGHNRKAKAKLKTLWEFLIMALDDFTLKILMVAAVVSIAIEMATSDHPEIAWIEGVAILIAVALSSGITTVNDFHKQN